MKKWKSIAGDPDGSDEEGEDSKKASTSKTWSPSSSGTTWHTSTSPYTWQLTWFSTESMAILIMEERGQSHHVVNLGH